MTRNPDEVRALVETMRRDATYLVHEHYPTPAANIRILCDATEELLAEREKERIPDDLDDLLDDVADTGRGWADLRKAIAAALRSARTEYRVGDDDSACVGDDPCGKCTMCRHAAAEARVRELELSRQHVYEVRDEYKARVRELEADKERLDWLDTVYVRCSGGVPGLSKMLGIDYEEYKGDTWRAAIDAARKAGEVENG